VPMSLLDNAKQLRANMTDAERALWQHLRASRLNGFKFRRQHPIGNYIVDFVCLEKRLIVELDGGQHQNQVIYDATRDAWLKREGFRILRIWNNEFLNNQHGALEQILIELEAHPLP